MLVQTLNVFHGHCRLLVPFALPFVRAAGWLAYWALFLGGFAFGIAFHLVFTVPFIVCAAAFRTALACSRRRGFWLGVAGVLFAFVTLLDTADANGNFAMHYQQGITLPPFQRALAKLGFKGQVAEWIRRSLVFFIRNRLHVRTIANYGLGAIAGAYAVYYAYGTVTDCYSHARNRLLAGTPWASMTGSLASRVSHLRAWIPAEAFCDFSGACAAARWRGKATYYCVYAPNIAGAHNDIQYQRNDVGIVLQRAGESMVFPSPITLTSFQVRIFAGLVGVYTVRPGGRRDACASGLFECYEITYSHSFNWYNLPCGMPTARAAVRCSEVISGRPADMFLWVTADGCDVELRLDGSQTYSQLDTQAYGAFLARAASGSKGITATNLQLLAAQCVSAEDPALAGLLAKSYRAGIVAFPADPVPSDSLSENDGMPATAPLFRPCAFTASSGEPDVPTRLVLAEEGGVLYNRVPITPGDPPSRGAETVQTFENSTRFPAAGEFDPTSIICHFTLSAPIFAGEAPVSMPASSRADCEWVVARRIDPARSLAKPPDAYNGFAAEFIRHTAPKVNLAAATDKEISGSMPQSCRHLVPDDPDAIARSMSRPTQVANREGALERMSLQVVGVTNALRFAISRQLAELSSNVAYAASFVPDAAYIFAGQTAANAGAYARGFADVAYGVTSHVGRVVHNIFVKAEPMPPGKPARVIVTCSPEALWYGSMLAKPVAEWFKSMPWYAFGVGCGATARKVHAVAKAHPLLASSDFSKYDASMPNCVQAWWDSYLLACFGFAFASVVAFLSRDTYNQHARTRSGVSYNLTSTTPSGCSATTVRNSWLQALFHYISFRNMGFDPDKAYHYVCKGIVAGDDGAYPYIGQDLAAAVEPLGMVVEIEVTSNKEPFVFLGRVYGSPATTSASCYDLTRFLPDFHIGTNIDAASAHECLRNKAAGLKPTDKDSPIIGDFIAAVEKGAGGREGRISRDNVWWSEEYLRVGDPFHTDDVHNGIVLLWTASKLGIDVCGLFALQHYFANLAERGGFLPGTPDMPQLYRPRPVPPPPGVLMGGTTLLGNPLPRTVMTHFTAPQLEKFAEECAAVMEKVWLAVSKPQAAFSPASNVIISTALRAVAAAAAPTPSRAATTSTASVDTPTSAATSDLAAVAEGMGVAGLTVDEADHFGLCRDCGVQFVDAGGSTQLCNCTRAEVQARNRRMACGTCRTHPCNCTERLAACLALQTPEGAEAAAIFAPSAAIAAARMPVGSPALPASHKGKPVKQGKRSGHKKR